MSDKVFVVYGRNASMRTAMFDFLRAIGLRPLEWGQSVDLTRKGSPYTGEVLDAAFAAVQAVVVLLTGDDIAVLRSEFRTADDPAYETKPTPQARPNVIFEAGMAFGTHPERTVIVEVGHLRPFSDVVGRNAVRLTNSTQSRQMLAQRLKNAGCPVDLSGTDWHTVGNFDSAAGPARTDVFVVKTKAAEPEVSTRTLETITKEKLLKDTKEKLFKEVLILLAQSADGQPISSIIQQIQTTWNISQTRAEVFATKTLDVISNEHYAEANAYNHYWITPRGKEYLVENELI